MLTKLDRSLEATPPTSKDLSHYKTPYLGKQVYTLIDFTKNVRDVETTSIGDDDPNISNNETKGVGGGMPVLN